MTCQFLTFYSNTVNGQNTTSTPRWVGINGIRKIFSDTNSALDTIAQNSNNAFSNTSWTQTDPANFISQLNSTYYMFSGSSLTNRNPAGSKKIVSSIIPTYISNYGQYNKDKTLLNSIYQEFTTKISYSISMIDQAKSYSQMVKNNIQSIKDSINSIDDNLKPLSDTFTTIETNIVDYWINYVNQNYF